MGPGKEREGFEKSAECFSLSSSFSSPSLGNEESKCIFSRSEGRKNRGNREMSKHKARRKERKERGKEAKWMKL